MPKPNANFSARRNLSWHLRTFGHSLMMRYSYRLLRRQLAQVGIAHLIETIHGTGYRFNPTDEPK